MTFKRVLTILLGIGALLLIAYIMANGIGLVDSLDFGAGAYYYADIPEFDKLSGSQSGFSDSTLAVVAFFIIWSIVIIGLLYLVKKIPKPSDENEEEE